jgi:hypothetical protein
MRRSSRKTPPLGVSPVSNSIPHAALPNESSSSSQPEMRFQTGEVGGASARPLPRASLSQLVHVGWQDREIRPDWRWSGSVTKKTGEAPGAQVRILPILALALFAFSPVKAAALEPVRAGQEGAIIRAVFVDKTLWTLSDANGSMRFVASGSESSTRRSTMSKVCRCQPHGATRPPRQWLFSA